jgi:hypothetical protein
MLKMYKNLYNQLIHNFQRYLYPVVNIYFILNMLIFEFIFFLKFSESKRRNLKKKQFSFKKSSSCHNFIELPTV